MRCSVFFARIMELCSISNLLCQLYIVENDIVMQNMYIIRDFWPLSQTKCPVGFQIFVTIDCLLLLDKLLNNASLERQPIGCLSSFGRMILPRKRQDEHAKGKSRKIGKIL